MLTNLAPNHLDRYRSLDEYYGDKAQLFRNADATPLWITNADDAAVQEMARARAGTASAILDRARAADGWYDRDGRPADAGRSELMPRAALPLLGDHNVANALAAALVAAELGCAIARIAAGLQSFRAIPHRVEPVREVDGRALDQRLQVHQHHLDRSRYRGARPAIRALLGGRHKGEPYTRLAERLRDRCRAVVAYGEAGPLDRAGSRRER